MLGEKGTFVLNVSSTIHPIHTHFVYISAHKLNPTSLSIPNS